MSFPSKKIASITLAVLALAGCSAGAIPSPSAPVQNPGPLRQCMQVVSHNPNVYETHPRKGCDDPDKPKPTSPTAPGCKAADGHVSYHVEAMRVGDQCFVKPSDIHLAQIGHFWANPAGELTSIATDLSTVRIRNMAKGLEIDLGINRIDQKFFIEDTDGVHDDIDTSLLPIRDFDPNGLTPGEPYARKQCNMPEPDSYIAFSVDDIMPGSRCYTAPAALKVDTDGHYWLAKDGFMAYDEPFGVMMQVSADLAEAYHTEIKRDYLKFTGPPMPRSAYDYPGSAYVPTAVVVK